MRRWAGFFRGRRGVRALAAELRGRQQVCEVLESRTLLTGDFAITQIIPGDATVGGQVFESFYYAAINSSDQVLVLGSTHDPATPHTTVSSMALFSGSQGSFVWRQGDPYSLTFDRTNLVGGGT